MFVLKITKIGKAGLLPISLMFLTFLLPPVVGKAQTYTPGVTSSLNLQASVVCDDVSLSWEENASAVHPSKKANSSYNLYRNDSLLNEEPLEETEFLDENVQVGSYTYYLEVVSGESQYRNYTDSSEVEVTQYFGRIDLETDNNGLNWSLEGTENAELVGYNLYRDGILIEEGCPQNFFIWQYPPENPHEYCVEAEFQSGCLSQSACDTVYPVSDSLFPPQNFQAAIDSSQASVNLTWHAPQNSTNTLEGYQLFRYLQSEINYPDEWTLVEENMADTTYTDTQWAGLEWGLYGYALKAVYQEGNSIAVKSDSLCNDCMTAFAIILEPMPYSPLDSTYYEVIGGIYNDTISGYYGVSSGLPNIGKGSYELKLKGSKVGTPFFFLPEISEPYFIIDQIVFLRYPRHTIADVRCNTVNLEWDWTFVGDDPDVIDMLAGFNIYRNDSLINPEPVDSAYFTDENVPVGTYEYYVKAAFKDTTESWTLDTVPVTISKKYGQIAIQITEHQIRWNISDTTNVDIAGYNLYKNDTVIGEMLAGSSFDYEYLHQAGEYVYCIEPVFADGCTGTVACDTVKATAGIQTRNFSDLLKMRPNPVRSVLHVKAPERLAVARCYDGKGIERLSKTTDKQKITLKTDRLSPGIYYLQVVTQNGDSGVKKFIVK